MATYKEIKGVTVQTRDEDPVTNTGSWASGNNTNSPHAGYGGSSGTYNAALVASEGPYGDKVELYDGTSWSETGDLNTARQSAFSAGTQPATWLAGGRTGGGTSTNNTELFNGSSWTEVNEMNTTRFASGSTGTYTAGIAFSGDTFTDITRAVETWDGTSWSTHPNNYDSDVSNIIAFGTTTAAITAGGFDGPVPRGGSNNAIATSYSYDGSTYTAITAMPQTLNSTTGTGTQTDGLVAGGDRYPAPNTANTLSWNGTAWSQVQDVPVSAYGWGAAKATTDTKNQVIFCGSPGQNTTTVDWAFPPPTAAILTEGSIFLSGNTTLKGFGKAAGIPSATWASGGSLNTARRLASGAGIQTASILISGYSPSPETMPQVEQYNGTSWTEIAEMNTPRYGTGAAGTSTAALCYGGAVPATKDETESWNGSAWTEVNDLNTGRYYAGSAGTQTSAMYYGGQSGSGVTETWDGTSWTEVNDLNEGRQGGAGFGTNSSSAQYTGGEDPGSAAIANSEQWDGSAWTEVNNLNEGRQFPAGSGDTSSGLAFGGNDGSRVNSTESWNGSSWSEVNNLGTTRTNITGSGSAVAGLAAAGLTTTVVANTEEFTADAGLGDITLS